MAKRVKTIRAGRLVKRAIYQTAKRNETPTQRAARQFATSEAQKAINYRNAAESLEFKLACNFSTRDLFVTLTYNNDHLPDGHAGAVAQMKRFIKTLRNEYRKNGRELKYIYAVEGHGADGRLHHHAVINTLGKGIERDREIIDSLWANGYTKADTLYKHYNSLRRCIDYDEIAGYMVKEGHEEKHPDGIQKFICSRNLEKPTVTTELLPDNTSIHSIDPPFDAVVIGGCYSQNTLAEWAYCKFILPKQKQQSWQQPGQQKNRARHGDFYLRGEY